MYSFGVMLWECIARKIPYPDMNHMHIPVAVATQPRDPAGPGPCVWGGDAVQLRYGVVGGRGGGGGAEAGGR